ncbi:MAG: tetratricopeptide repeat protein [Candidatus Melainabacteria bacterium]|nr:tetratricopeptide repeat protein [Candidatus Melainabacteria bacterium]
MKLWTKPTTFFCINSLLVVILGLSGCEGAHKADGPVATSSTNGSSTEIATGGDTKTGAGTASGAKQETTGLKKRLTEEKGIMAAFPRGSVNIYAERANAGDFDAQVRLAICHYIGAGTPEDKGEAKKWFAKAAEANDKKAQYCLAYMLENGEGGPADKREAFIWYKIAAEGRNPYSSLAEREIKRLSVAFDQVERDRIEKHVQDWFNLSKFRKTRAEKTRRSY